MDNIKLLNPSDIISESMNTINENFRAIASSEDVTEYKLLQFSKDFRKELDDLKVGIDYMQLGILNSVDKLNNRITTLPSMDNIQDAIDAAISNANINIEEFITLTARTEVGSALGGYAKTSYVDGEILNISSAFTSYKTNAEKKQAEASMVVANSTFLLGEHGKFIWKTDAYGGTVDEESNYAKIQDYYYALSPSEKSDVDRNSEYDNKLEDPDVIQRLAQLCQKRFKTIATELANLTLEVGDGVSRTSIVNAVKGSRGTGEDEDIVAAIFVEATKDGSQITLDADKIAINSTNFKVNPTTHEVTVKGKITATSLVIGGNDLTKPAGARAFVQAYQSYDGGEGGSGDYEPYDDGWLTGAFQEINAADGVLLAGNLLVGNSEGNVTAGMMGASTSGNDLRFWAGSDFNGRTNAPFQVYEDGHVVLNDLVIGEEGDNTRITPNDGKLIAKNAEITGNITANTFSSESGVKSLDSGGTYTIGTYINSEQFLVSAKTTKNNQTNDAKIYITVLPELSLNNIDGVPEELLSSASDGKLIGVPVLCFEYKGLQYYMTPGAWRSTGSGGGNTSNMYFNQETNIDTSISFANSQRTLCEQHSEYQNAYVFNQNRNVGSGSTSYILTRVSGKKYEFGYDYGSLSSSEITDANTILINNGLSIGKVGVNIPANSGYIYNSLSKTPITTENAQNFATRLYTGVTYEGVADEYEYITPDSGEMYSVITSIDGINPNIISWLKNRVFEMETANGGSWSWAYDFDSNVSMVEILKNINPFNNYRGNDNANLMYCEVTKRVSGGNKVKYSNGSVTTIDTTEAYGLYSCEFAIYYNDSNTIGVTLNNGTNKTYKIENVSIEVTYGMYASGFSGDGATLVMNVLNNTTFTKPSAIGVKVYVYGYDVNHSYSGSVPVLTFTY